MISFVKGTVADIGENCLVVENGGIGYEIYMTGQDLGKARIGDEKKIHTFLYVREDTQSAFRSDSVDTDQKLEHAKIILRKKTI